MTRKTTSTTKTDLPKNLTTPSANPSQRTAPEMSDLTQNKSLNSLEASDIPRYSNGIL
jgi:hypothetical protein